MRHLATPCAALVVLALLGRSVAAGRGPSAQDAAPDPDAIRGTYTTEQAARGQVTFENNCSECHVSDLSGRAGPALKGPVFLERWRGKTSADLLEKIRTTMPADRRTVLSEARALDLVAFLLRENGTAASEQPLDRVGADHVPVD
jgi:mono/diheme cytochrome c family protein